MIGVCRDAASSASTSPPTATRRRFAPLADRQIRRVSVAGPQSSDEKA
jgi:hypothetical protein